MGVGVSSRSQLAAEAIKRGIDRRPAGYAPPGRPGGSKAGSDDRAS